MVFNKRVFVLILVFFLVGCVTNPPIEEYTLAYVAIIEARRSEAARFAASYMHRAEEAYRLGQDSYKKNDFDNALKYFIHARINAEKAESMARVARIQSGEGL